jgi:hypothetical protein
MADNDRLHPDQASQGCPGHRGSTEHRALRTEFMTAHFFYVFAPRTASTHLALRTEHCFFDCALNL